MTNSTHWSMITEAQCTPDLMHIKLKPDLIHGHGYKLQGTNIFHNFTHALMLIKSTQQINTAAGQLAYPLKRNKSNIEIKYKLFKESAFQKHLNVYVCMKLNSFNTKTNPTELRLNLYTTSKQQVDIISQKIYKNVKLLKNIGYIAD